MNRLGLSYPYSAGVFTNDHHCFRKFIKSAEHFDPWFHRIKCIPDWFIESLCKEATTIGISKQESKAIAEFLKFRKHHIDGIIENYKGFFPNIQWLQKGKLF